MEPVIIDQLCRLVVLGNAHNYKQLLLHTEFAIIVDFVIKGDVDGCVTVLKDFWRSPF